MPETPAPKGKEGFFEKVRDLPSWVWLGGAAAIALLFVLRSRGAAGAVPATAAPTETQVPQALATPDTTGQILQPTAQAAPSATIAPPVDQGIPPSFPPLDGTIPAYTPPVTGDQGTAAQYGGFDVASFMAQQQQGELEMQQGYLAALQQAISTQRPPVPLTGPTPVNVYLTGGGVPAPSYLRDAGQVHVGTARTMQHHVAAMHHHPATHHAMAKQAGLHARPVAHRPAPQRPAPKPKTRLRIRIPNLTRQRGSGGIARLQ